MTQSIWAISDDIRKSRNTAPCGTFLSFADRLAQRALETPDALALPDAAGALTFQDLDRRANQVANALRDSAVSAGDRIAFLGMTSARSIELLMGAARVGAVFVPIIWRLEPQTIEAIIHDCGSRLLFVDPIFLAKVTEATCPPSDIVLMSDGESQDDRHFDAWRSAASIKAPRRQAKADDPVLQLYIGGAGQQLRSLIVTHANGELVMESVVGVPDGLMTSN